MKTLKYIVSKLRLQHKVFQCIVDLIKQVKYQNFRQIDSDKVQLRFFVEEQGPEPADGTGTFTIGREQDINEDLSVFTISIRQKPLCLPHLSNLNLPWYYRYIIKRKSLNKIKTFKRQKTQRQLNQILNFYERINN